MRLTKEAKQKLTEKIRNGAAAAFRLGGYHQINLDGLMKESQLTRGAFYSHFKSKSELFEGVVRYEHPLLKMLVRRDGETAGQLRDQMLEIFDGYLSPEHLEEVFLGCSVAALTGDVARANEQTKAGFGEAFDDILREMARGQDCSPTQFTPTLILAAGAVTTAYAMGSKDQRTQTLKTAHKQVKMMLEDLCNDAGKSV